MYNTVVVLRVRRTARGQYVPIDIRVLVFIKLSRTTSVRRCDRIINLWCVYTANERTHTGDRNTACGALKKLGFLRQQMRAKRKKQACSACQEYQKSHLDFMLLLIKNAAAAAAHGAAAENQRKLSKQQKTSHLYSGRSRHIVNLLNIHCTKTLCNVTNMSRFWLWW